MKGYKVFMPLVLLLEVCIDLLKREAINIVFAPTFEPINAYSPHHTVNFKKLTVWFIYLFGGVWSVYAYAINYFSCLVCMLVEFRKLIFVKPNTI